MGNNLFKKETRFTVLKERDQIKIAFHQKTVCFSFKRVSSPKKQYIGENRNQAAKRVGNTILKAATTASEEQCTKSSLMWKKTTKTIENRLLIIPFTPSK